MSLAQGIAAAWAIGVAIASVRLARGVVHVRGIIRESEPLDGAWAARARAIADALGVGRNVRLALSRRVAAPSVVGVFRPIILLPIAVVSSLPVASVEALLAHELAHVRRHDALVALVQSAIEVLLFYHPAVHFASRQLSAAREACCDDAASAAVGDPLLLARALAAAERLRADRPVLALSSNGGPLMQRIRRLVEPARVSTPRWAAPIVAAVCLLVAGAVPCLACVASSSSDEVAVGTHRSADAVGIRWLPASVTRWSPQIEDAARRHDVDPDLLAIVTLIESNGDPTAVSPAGAVGLVQVMPPTADRIAAARGLATHADLGDPATNLDYGASYLADQLRAFGDVELAAAAYNAGPDAVHAWLAGQAPLPDETVHYKAKVARLWAQRRAATRE